MKKKLCILMILLLLAGALSACGGSSSGGSSSGDSSSESTDSEESEGLSDMTVVLAEDSQWWGNDLSQLDGGSSSQMLVSDCLVTLGDDGSLGPNMAEKVEVSDDGLTITLTMPEDLKFATGEPVLPEDVVASIEYYKTNSPMSFLMDTIESMDIDGQKVILHLSEFTSDLFNTLAGQMYNIQDKDVLDSTSKEDLLWGAQPYGMYYLDEYVEGSHVVLKRNDYYKTYNPYAKNKGPGYYAEITIRFMPEEFSRATAMNTGDIDAMFAISQDGLAQITREDAKAETLHLIPNIGYFGFNLNSEPLKDIKVRQAIALAVDREKIEKDSEGMAIPMYSIASEGVTCRNEEFAEWYQSEYGLNREKAAQLLEEAGWKDTDGDGYLDKDGKMLELLFVANDGATENIVAQSLQNQLKELGIKLNLEMYADYYHYDVISQGKYDIGLQYFGWMEPITLFMYAMGNDPEMLSTAGIEEEYMAKIIEAQHELNTEKRTEIVGELEHMIADNMIAVPLYTTLSNLVMSDNFDGIIFRPDGANYYCDVRPSK